MPEQPSSLDGSQLHDVLVIGAGPAGASCAYWLARAGWDVALVEKKRFPREKTCGDGLTPRAIRQLDDIGLAEGLDTHHRYAGLRAMAFGKTLEMAWPHHDGFPDHGVVITRHDLDQMVASRAEKAGALLLQEVEAVAPLHARTDGSTTPSGQSSLWAPVAPGPDRSGQARTLSYCSGVLARDTSAASRAGPYELRARYVVVADGSNSRIGRGLGAMRNRSYPLGMAVRGYWPSPRHDDPWIESHLDIRNQNGEVVPGYGWIFPLGDGRVNVGAGLLSTSGRWKGVNTSQILDAFLGWAPKSWGLSPESACGPITGGKLPMGLSVGPRTGPNSLLIGDAAGSINPFNGEGISYAYETGRLAAITVGEALSSGDPAALSLYEPRLQQAYGQYYQVARVFVEAISHPQLLRALVETGMHSRSLMEWVLRIMANLLRTDERGVAEGAYRAAVRLTVALERGGLLKEGRLSRDG